MIRVGIIGSSFGKNVHLPAFRKDSRCEVVGLCSTRLENLKAEAASLKISKISNHWMDFVKDPDIDAISIATPPIVQAQIIPKAIEHGKHVFCEKPIGLSFEHAKKWAVEADRKQLAHMIDFEFPELKTWQLTKNSLSKIAPILSVKVLWETQTQAHAAKKPSWKIEPQRGGGTLQNLGCHALYNLEWFLGPIDTIGANLFELEEPVELDIKMKNGTKAHIRVSANAPQGAGHRIEFLGKNGSFTLENREKDYMKGFAFSYDEDTVIEDQNSQDGRINAVHGVTKRFIDWIADKTPAHPSLWQAARNELLMEVARKSHASKKPLVVPA
jgi:predicted dehydrogenase